MKTIVTLKVRGTKVWEFEDLWNENAIKKNRLGTGMLRTRKGGKIYNQFMEAFHKFLETHPNSIDVSELRSDTIYDKKDLEQSPILEFVICNERRISFKTGTSFFELRELCPECKRSAYVQKEILSTILPKRDEDIYCLICDEDDAPTRWLTFAWIVSRRFKEFLEEHAYSCVSFDSIIDKESNQKSEDYFQLHINHVYPPCKVPPTLKTEENICSKCNCPSGVFLGKWNSFNSMELYYSAQGLDISPIGISHEQWGKQFFLTDVQLRNILVSQDLFREIKSKDFKGIGFRVAHIE